MKAAQRQAKFIRSQAAPGNDRRLSSRSLACYLLPAFFLAAILTPAGAAEAVAWRTGRDFQQTLDRQLGTAGLTWSGQTLRDGITNLSRASGIRIAVLIDRRIDPGSRPQIALGDVTLDEAISRIAALAGAEHSRVGSAVYIGPAATARRLRTVVDLRKQEIRKLRPTDAKRLSQAKALRWDDFTEPREILKSLAGGAGATIVNLEVIPHDLWAAAELPAMPLAERLTLVAGAFDLTFAFDEDGKTLRLVPIPERVAVRRTHTAGESAGEIAGKLAAAFPDCKISVAGTKLQVDGRVEDHLLIATALSGKPVRKPTAPVPVTLEGTTIERFAVTNQQLGPLIKTIAARFSLEVEFDGAALRTAGIALDQLVSISEKSITPKQLLDKITKPYGLEYELRDKKLIVRPRKTGQK